MTELSDSEMDRDEEMIPKVAAAATHAAYLLSVSAGHTLIMAKNGVLVQVEPDGSEIPLRALSAKHRVKPGEVFRIKAAVY
ncbi:hypothetical protein LG309_07670 [Stutzerimonas chloritidismutans]|uniref:hypothetical protein n=1 Tax=Stutzerimonas stutzeri subgroup TaxID=578833 RepID=UPI001D6C3D4B|nr:hypothetical protein [Stutzerimonas stutzeri]MBU0562991.1 hypothetical protein [Gammaproteobacteria bacterium]MBU0919704.1 hypothetical protein [Gammaproteobacteria bacterium]MBU1807489.1 hypothetical protein [Gammaproteobacteria bacterium]MDH0081353.1 hypothetical protein [Stutzerimonas stutzeri]